jgi:exportin-1
VPSFALRVQELFRVLTDRLHKSAFKLHVDILRNMFRLVEMGVILAPLGDPAKDNRQFVREFVAGFLMESFPHLAP